ncbi:MAG TPA: hypothetical protein VHN98_13370 [Acidimicrobiales bacterium]|nr:hypothetical protein [Acidimicrobiales bacterium]
MAQSDMLKRYLDAGMAFTQMTRDRAEAIVKELVKAGEVQREKAEERVNELVDRSRKNTEELIALIRREVSEQLRAMGLDDLAKRASVSGASAPAKKATAKKAPAKKTTAKKAPAKKTTAKKATANKASAVKKTAGAKKATATKKATAATKSAKKTAE